MANYCAREHQLVDWNQGKHKELCPKAAEPGALRPQGVLNLLFPEYELVSEDEPEGKTEAENGESLLEHKLGSIQLEEPETSERYEETEVDVDKAFLKFQKRILREPEQVVR